MSGVLVLSCISYLLATNLSMILSKIFIYYSNGLGRLTKLILKGYYDTTINTPWPTISPEGKDLVRKLMEPSADARITATCALNHPWFVHSD